MTQPTIEQFTLERLKVGVRSLIPAEMATLASTAQLRAYMDDITQSMILDLRAQVLAEQLPPQTTSHTVRVQTTDPRFASWWDMFKGTYQQRWWMRWREWKVRYVQTPVTVQRTITVDVRDHWTYPRAAIALPEERFGSPVLVSMVQTSDRPWFSD